MNSSLPSFRGATELPGPSLRQAPPILFEIWNYREKIEREAIDQFERLAHLFRALNAETKIIALTEKAAKDEGRHALFCQRIKAFSRSPLPRPVPEVGIALGPPTLTPRESALYTSVALGCVTETLSTALLIEMQKSSEPKLIRHTVKSILEDEIDHSRIGWAYLASRSKSEDVSWLSRFVPSMVREALYGELPRYESEDLSHWGVLGPKTARKIMADTLREVVLPGLRGHGIPS